MKLRITFIILFIALIVLSGCQVTPEKPIVVNKGDNKLHETLQSTPAPTQQMVIPNRWVETYNLTNIECNIDAEIIVPNTNVFPVYKVKKRVFSTDYVSKIIKRLTAGATQVRTTSPTKEELMNQLILIKKGAYVVDDNGGRWEPYEGQQEDIANIEEQIRNAKPEVFEPITDNPFTLPINNTYLMADNSRVYLDIDQKSIRYNTEKYGIIQFESWLAEGEAKPGEPAGTTLENVKISEDDACLMVSALMSELGIENLEIAETEKARIIDEMSGNTITEGWEVILTRNDGKCVPVNLNSAQLVGLLDFGSEDYVERWWQETVSIFVDETGIRSFCWDNPLEVVEEMNLNAPLLAFEDIKERIRKSIEFGYMRRVDKGQVNGEMKLLVDKIVLTSVLVPVKDDLDHQMLLPAWIVYYKNSFFFEDKEYEGLDTVFAVNAIDGSSIDLAFIVYMPEMP